MKRATQCPEFDQLLLLVEGEADDASAVDLRRHLTGCSDCSSRFAELESHALLERRVATAMGRDVASLGSPGFAPTGFTDLREIGRGGMGVVYAARQLDPPREVALKFMRTAHAVDEHALRLFRREIRALARLQHPNIAALYDAATTTRGESCLVMELVRGESLLRFADKHELSISERQLLFVRVGRAVQAAHQRGVIHRDLKPSNILVDESGEPKVLDFGLAKIEVSPDASASLLTEVGSVRGTLPYMSPEQSSGVADGVDSRSDVYSLGVVLYELLTGHLPIDVADVPLHEAARRIHDVAPAAPSSHDKRLRGDLDTIVLKALEKEPRARYASAAALCDDIERHLADEVILARPPSGAYLLRKLVARHRLASALVAGLVALAVGSAVWLAHLYTQAEALRAQSDRAAQEARDARDAALVSQERQRVEARTKSRVSQVIVHMIQQAAEDRGGDDVRVADILPRAEATMRAEAESDPEVSAVLGMVLAEIKVSVGLFDEAESLFRFAMEHEPVDDRLDWDAVRMRGMLARLCMERGRLDEAEVLIVEAEALAPRITDPSTSFALELRERRAALLNKRGDYAQAEAEYAELIEAYEALPNATDEGRAGMVGGLCIALKNQGKRAEALEAARREVDLDSAAFGPHATRTLVAKMNLGSVLMGQGDVATARDMFQDIADAHAQALGPDHTYTLWAKHSLGNAWSWLGEEARALEILEPTLERERRVLGPSSATTLTTLDVVTSCQYHLKRFEDAERTSREMYTSVDAVYQAPHQLWLRARFNLGRTLYTNKHYEECESVLLEGWNALEQHGLATHSLHSAFAKFLTTLYDKTDRKELADKYRAQP